MSNANRSSEFDTETQKMLDENDNVVGPVLSEANREKSDRIFDKIQEMKAKQASETAEQTFEAAGGEVEEATETPVATGAAPTMSCKEIRKAMGLNQAAFAAAIEITQGRVSQMEKGTFPPSKKILKKLAELEAKLAA
jgi:DNA-binding transcriptional regulator YiaG